MHGITLNPIDLFITPLAQILEDHTATAVSRALTLSAVDDATADALSRAADIGLAVVDWDRPETHTVPTDEQTFVSITRWAVGGNIAALSWQPSRHWASRPSVTVGHDGEAIVMGVEARHVTAAEVVAGRLLARGFVETHLEAISAQIDGWLPTHQRRIRAATKRRRQLLEEAGALNSASALDALGN